MAAGVVAVLVLAVDLAELLCLGKGRGRSVQARGANSSVGGTDDDVVLQGWGRGDVRVRRSAGERLSERDARHSCTLFLRCESEGVSLGWREEAGGLDPRFEAAHVGGTAVMETLRLTER